MLYRPLGNSRTVSEQGYIYEPCISQCVENAKNRPWEPHKYESKEAQDSNFEMLINWIKDYRKREDEFSYRSHMKFYEGFVGAKFMYTENQSHS